MDGDVLVFNQGSLRNLKIGQGTHAMQGKIMIRNNHIKMVEDAITKKSK